MPAQLRAARELEARIRAGGQRLSVADEAFNQARIGGNPSKIADARGQVVRALREQRALLQSVPSEISRIIQARRLRKVRAPAADVGKAPGLSVEPTPTPQPREAKIPEPTPGPTPKPQETSPADKALETARAQLGKPYEYGKDGPDSFDCSGLTRYAWKGGGVDLPHSSRAQYDAVRHVSRRDLRPGDLVFYGDPVHHVGIYEGDGTMINAPETGEHVRRDSIDRRDFTGAGRPSS